MFYIRLFLFSVFIFLAACGGGGGESAGQASRSNLANAFQELSDIEPANPNGPYSHVLKSCLTPKKEEDLCILSILPFIGLEHSDPDVDAIMDRVLVSHEWMAVRFREVISNLPSDIRALMKGVTAIVIDADIRPSFYTGVTGGMYIDPQYLWLSVEEKETVSKEEDFRTNFSKDLSFIYLWRYVKNNEYAYPFFSLDGPEERTLDDILLRNAALIYHELAHANDVFPPSLIHALEVNQTVADSANLLDELRISSRLKRTKALSSETFFNLARVSFRGEPATESQKLTKAESIGPLFENDGAIDYYNYASIFEDVASVVS